VSRARKSIAAVAVCWGALALGGSASAGDRWSADADRDRPERGGARIGLLGGIGLPRPLALEAIVGIDRTVAIGGEYSFLPRSTIGGVDTTFWALAGDARIFPFRGPFFLGFRGGHQRLGGEVTETIGSFGTFNGSMTVDTWFINPRIGVLFMWDSALAVGIDAGVQIPLSSSRSTSLPAGLPNDPRVTNVTDALTSVGDTLGSSVLPTFDVLRLGLVL
jgi:hypothetical protein